LQSEVSAAVNNQGFFWKVLRNLRAFAMGKTKENNIMASQIGNCGFEQDSVCQVR
jgi:hypothetical protein